jgi:hypothetical protein
VRTWTRATLDEHCGHCRAPIATGQPMLVITLAALGPRVPFRRCPACAGEPVPADLPELPIRAATRPMAMSHIVHRGSLPLDWKQKQSGEQ